MPEVLDYAEVLRAYQDAANKVMAARGAAKEARLRLARAENLSLEKTLVLRARAQLTQARKELEAAQAVRDQAESAYDQYNHKKRRADCVEEIAKSGAGLPSSWWQQIKERLAAWWLAPEERR